MTKKPTMSVRFCGYASGHVCVRKYFRRSKNQRQSLCQGFKDFKRDYFLTKPYKELN